MKLIECYVNNFGKLSDFSYTFDKGLNVISRENGFGKSTLAAFIKSMLFGLEDTKKPKLDENDRKKYEPWQGGSWGGTLTLSFGGKEYRVERIFSKKASLDEIKIYELATGKITESFLGKEPGEIFLGIDREGFERSIFLSERNIDEKKSNNSLSAKLSKLTGVAFDMSELDEATKLLEEERRYYYKQGGGGAISEISNKITELEFKKRELLSLEKKHDSDAVRIADAEKELKLIRAENNLEIEEEKKRALRLDRYNEYKNKLSEKKELDARASEILKLFGGKIPEKQTLYFAQTLKNEISRGSEELLALKEELDSYKKLPNESDIKDASLLSLKIKEHDEKIRTFENKKIDTGAHNSTKITLLSILGLSLIPIGIALGIIYSPLFLISAAGALLFIFEFLKSKKNSRQQEVEISELYEKRAEYESALSSILLPFGLAGANADFAVSELERRIKEKESQLTSYRDKAIELREKERKLSDIKYEYPVINQYSLSELSLKIDTYVYLSANSERLARETSELMNKFDFKESDEYKLSYENERASDVLLIKERALTLLKNEFSLDELSLEELEEISSELEELKLTEAEYRYKLGIVKKTKAYLEMASDSLTAKYLGKTRESFSKYVEIISKTYNQIGIDTSFAITKSEGGQSRQKESFSKGTRDLFTFAMRLSLSDSLYEKELPFLMLDDPFAYFDEEKLKAALALINELSKSRQIIYFTANKSRT